jgi:hypothetical protein
MAYMRELIPSIVLIASYAVTARADIPLLPFQIYIPGPHFSTYNSGSERPLLLAVNSKEEWQNLWREVEPRMSRDEKQNAPHPLPDMDFDRYTLLVATSGSRPTGGYVIGFEAVHDGFSMDADVYELRPGRECTVTTSITHPIAMALISKTDKPVHFRVTRADIDCHG